MAIISTPLSFKENEIEVFVRWTENKSHFYKSSEKKIVGFHGKEDGTTEVSKIFLFAYHILGFSFTCCHPRAVKERLGFGNFLWEDYEGITSVQGYVINQNTFENGQISRCCSSELEFSDGYWRSIYE